MTDPAPKRGDCVLIAFPFVAPAEVQRKLRPVVVQSDAYNRRRAAVVVAAITTSRRHLLPCKVEVRKASKAGRAAGLRLDSVVDCQTLATIPTSEIVRTLGTFPSDTMRRIDAALTDELGLGEPRRARLRP
jgi:mRNA-degrading endonuclease toxin of MazEF toxin-antitoxin module